MLTLFSLHFVESKEYLFSIPVTFSSDISTLLSGMLCFIVLFGSLHVSFLVFFHPFEISSLSYNRHLQVVQSAPDLGPKYANKDIQVQILERWTL